MRSIFKPTVRRSYTVGFRCSDALKQSSQPNPRNPGISWAEVVARRLMDLAAEAGFSCSSLDLWRDWGWRFELSKPDVSQVPLECIVAPVEADFCEVIAVLSVVPSLKWLLRNPDASLLTAAVIQCDDWLKKLDVFEVQWSLDASPNFADKRRWTVSGADVLMG